MLNVIVCAWLKGIWEGEKKEIVITIAHIAIYAILFTIGCFINAASTIAITIMLFAVTALWIGAGDALVCANFNGNPYPVWSMWLLIFIPFIVFIYYFTLVFGVSLVYIIGIPILFVVCCPLIAFYEDVAGAHNIFELVFEITWTPELERFHKSMK